MSSVSHVPAAPVPGMGLAHGTRGFSVWLLYEYVNAQRHERKRRVLSVEPVLHARCVLGPFCMLLQ